MVFLKQKREQSSDHFLTLKLLVVAKLTEHFVREQIIKSLNTIMVHFKISVLIILSFWQSNYIPRNCDQKIFSLPNLRIEGGKGGFRLFYKKLAKLHITFFLTLIKERLKKQTNANFKLLSSYSLICNWMFFPTMVVKYYSQLFSPWISFVHI